jgi:hypothetical protein
MDPDKQNFTKDGRVKNVANKTVSLSELIFHIIGVSRRFDSQEASGLEEHTQASVPGCTAALMSQF